MKIDILKSKLEVFVTGFNKEKEEALILDKRLMNHSNLTNYEKIHITCDAKKERITTYVVEGKLDSRMAELNGNLAKHFGLGDKITILSYQQYNPTFQYKPHPVFVETKYNKVIKAEQK